MGIVHLRALHRFTIDHYMQVSVGLFFDGRYHPRMPVPYVAHRNTADQIDIGPSIGIPERRAFRTNNMNANGLWRSLCNMLLKKLTGIHNSTAKKSISSRVLIIPFRRLALPLYPRLSSAIPEGK